MAENASIEKYSKLGEQINDALPGLIELLVNETEEYWINKASSIGGWGDKYARAIKSEVSGDSGSVYLDENAIDPQSRKPFFMFAMMVEEGVKSWSIKDALMKSKKAKIGKDGVKYIIIPLPVATPRKSGQGKQLSTFGKRTMTQDMQNMLKSGGKVSGGTIKSGTRKISAKGLAQFSSQKYHSHYGLFRRVSENSKGWQYPNKSPQPVFDGVKRYVDMRMKEIMADFCRAVVKEALS
jgi:hypothetical protein